MEQFSTGITNATLSAKVACTGHPLRSTAKACGKAIIVGEHAVVYGAKAVAMPLPQHHMHVSLTPDPSLRENQLLIGNRQVSPHVALVVQDAFQALNQHDFTHTIEGKVSLPIGAGLGSSATLCVVILKVIAASLQIELAPFELATLANQLEMRFHGRPSGLDTAVVAYESIIEFCKGRRPKLIQANEASRFSFVLIDSGVRSSTLTMIKKAAPYFTGSSGEGRVRAFDSISEQVSDALRAGEHHSVADGMQAAHHRLADAGVVSPELQHIIDECCAVGTLAAKLTGAGGGGAVLALLDPQAPEAQVCELKKRMPNLKHFRVELP